MHVHVKKETFANCRERVLSGYMTINAEAEKPDQVLFIKRYDGNHKFRAEPVGSAKLFDDDKFHSVAAGDPDTPPNPGGHTEHMQDSVSVRAISEVGGYGGVVDGVQIPSGHHRTVKGIIFTGG